MAEAIGISMLGARIKSRDGGPTQEELAAGHPQVTAMSLAPTVSAAELEQLQQTAGLPLAIARESLLTGWHQTPCWWRLVAWS